jgi:hypothetical protein
MANQPLTSEERHEIWTRVSGAFQPTSQFNDAGLKAAQAFYFDRSTSSVTSLVQNLYLDIQNSASQKQIYKALLSGQTGSGKTSELIHLGQLLGTNGFFVVFFDAEQSLHLETTNQFEVLLGLGAALYNSACDFGLKPKQKLFNEFQDSFSKIIKNLGTQKNFAVRALDILTNTISFVYGKAGEMIANTAQQVVRLGLGLDEREVRTLETAANKGLLLSKLAKILQDIKEQAQMPIVVVIDGLDKTKLQTAKNLFQQNTLLADIPVSLIYAAPIELYYRQSDPDSLLRCRLLSNPPVCHRPTIGTDLNTERTAHPEGKRVLNEIIDKRLRAIEVPRTVINTKARELLIRYSGGVIRELIRSVRDASRIAQISKSSTMTEEHVQIAVNEKIQELDRRLTVTYRDALSKIMKEGRLLGGPHAEIEDELLRSIYLISYAEPNSPKPWFDVHPAILDLLRVS